MEMPTMINADEHKKSKQIEKFDDIVDEIYKHTEEQIRKKDAPLNNIKYFIGGALVCSYIHTTGYPIFEFLADNANPLSSFVGLNTVGLGQNRPL